MLLVSSIFPSELGCPVSNPELGTLSDLQMFFDPDVNPIAQVMSGQHHGASIQKRMISPVNWGTNKLHTRYPPFTYQTCT